MRRINDGLLWLFAAMDYVSPSVYLGIPDNDAHITNTTAYVQSVVVEAKRLADYWNKKIFTNRRERSSSML